MTLKTNPCTIFTNLKLRRLTCKAHVLSKGAFSTVQCAHGFVARRHFATSELNARTEADDA